jgi:hypothetical protein
MRLRINDGKVYVLACTTEGSKCYQMKNKVARYEKKSLWNEKLFQNYA